MQSTPRNNAPDSKGQDRRLWAALRGRWKRREGYAVDAAEAIRLLALEHPEAAQWWRENAPHLIDSRRRFLFDRNACQPIDAPSS
jgi:hypothetical protein